ncbi:MAG: NACHT domain-containing protein, partial [Anaerolineales bacterium]|nr:NACHT domain-containing protein [Anaerolineales bacterium]
MTSSSGSVHAQGNITAHDIITGLKIDKVEIVLRSLDDLTRLAGRSEVKFKPHPDGGLELLAGDGQSLLALEANLVQAFRQFPQAADLSLDHRYRCYAAWLLAYQPLNPPAAVAARDFYIQLPGHLSWDWDDEGLQGHLCELTWVGDGPQRQLKRERLADVTAALAKHPAFVLLGAPGSGKSTVLRRLARDAAQAYLAGRSPRLPLLLELGSYYRERHSPLEFAGAEWTAQVAADFVNLARQGRLLLLADGLNEMPYLPAPAAGERADDWRRFVAQFFAEAAPTGSRAVLASRDQGDYEQPLGLPRVEIEPLQPEQIEQFAAIRLGSQADAFLKALERLDLWPLARVPISLFFLTQLFQPASGDLPANKGLLFKAYADLLWRQLYPKAPPPEREAHLTALAHLGYAMQDRGESTILPAADILALLPPQVRLPKQFRPAETPPELVFERAWRSGLFSQVSEPDDTYKFSHQLLQEHFAARAMLTRWSERDPALPQLWRTPRTPA